MTEIAAMNAVLKARPYQVDAIDRQIILATQAGLPLVAQPWDSVAGQLGLEPDEVIARVENMQACGIIRRIGAVPNHYALGYRANGMSVWNIPDDMVAELGRQVGDLEFVSHCYERPRHLPMWPYNLFAMVHGHSRDEVADRVKVIAGMLRGVCRGHEVLYSTRILKKTGMRIPAD
jgi:DNA-binding Lrp family transcriptional regulator